MKVVAISHAHLNQVYRDKFEELAKDKSIDLTLIVPHRFKNELFDRAYSKRYNLICRRLIFPSSFHLSFFRSINKTLKKLKPDIIYMEEEPCNLSAYLVMRSAKKIKSKFIFYTWQNIKKRYPFPFSLFYRSVLSYAKHAVAGNNDAKIILKEKGFKGRISVIPQMGVQKQKVIQKKSPKELRNLIYLGRIVPEKGIETLINALTLIDSNIRLTIVGEGPYKEHLVDLANKNSVLSRIEFRKQCAFEDVPMLLAQHHALVLPSKTTSIWKEQFGRVLIEAMAYGVPVIGSDSGDIPTVIGDAGLIFKESDAEDLAKKIKLLFNNQAIYQRLKKQGINRVERYYLNSVLAKSTIHVLDEVYRDER